MQAPGLVATDVDGTLLDPAEHVSPRNAAAVRQVVASGVPFVLVTGRPQRWIPPVSAELPQVRLAVCANGGLLYDAVEDRVLWDQAMPVPLLAELADAALATIPGCGLAVERVGGSVRGPSPFLAEPGYRNAWPEAVGAIVDRADLLAEPAVKLLVREPGLLSDAMVAALAPVIGGAADITFSHSRGLVEISAPGVTKASGLAEVAAKLGVPAAEVLAFGDMPNDLEMLQWAGHGVAMANAHPALQAVADEVTASNAEDGVALVLERWF
ncbi:HAD family hydrolase [Pseudonocardia sp. CA-107938]|uniref:HAD family hydrolase n=1 Tax=Pseudonocardia sp. CA-107938 TaxID=3240021 RepID=UPI003D8BC504